MRPGTFAKGGKSCPPGTGNSSCQGRVRRYSVSKKPPNWCAIINTSTNITSCHLVHGGRFTYFAIRKYTVEFEPRNHTVSMSGYVNLIISLISMSTCATWVHHAVLSPARCHMSSTSSRYSSILIPSGTSAHRDSLLLLCTSALVLDWAIDSV